MNTYTQQHQQYEKQVKLKWQSMSFISKAFAIIISILLLFSSLFAGIFIFSTGLIIAFVLYIKSKLSQWFYKPKKHAHSTD